MELSGIDRRAMAEKFEEVHGLSRRYGNPYSVILLDIDHFKNDNDTMGHVMGDDAIRYMKHGRRGY